MCKCKILLPLFLTFILCIGLSINCYGESAIKVYLDSKQLTFSDAQPFLDSSNRTQVPLRVISENLGATIGWNPDTKEITITKDEDLLVLTINSKSMIKNGATITMDTAPMLVGNRTMVPLRFVSENLGVAVEWIAAEYKVVIKTAMDPGNIIVAVKPSDQWVVDLARDNASIGNLYLVDSMQTVDYVTGLKEFTKDTNSTLQVDMFTGTNQFNGASVGVSTDEIGYDIVIYQFNGTTLSFDATWVALVTIFGTSDATKVWSNLTIMYNNLEKGIITESIKGSISGYTYDIQLTSPDGYEFYFTKK